MLKIGITGGIGTGKSTVAKIFGILGVPVYEADQRAKEIIEENPEVIYKIKNLLGEKAYDSQGFYDRKYVAEQIFENKTLLIQLNNIVHPTVRDDFMSWAEFQKDKGIPYVLKEAAIMEKGQGLDKIIVVHSPLVLRISRTMKRDRRSEEAVENIIKNQKSEEAYLALADFVVNNNEKDFLVPRVLEIDKQLKFDS